MYQNQSPAGCPIDEGQLPAPERSGKIEFEVGVQDRPIAGAHCKQGGRWGQQPIGTRKLLRGPVAFLGPAERVAARNGEGRAGGTNHGAVRQFADWARYRVYPFTATCQPLRVQLCIHFVSQRDALLSPWPSRRETLRRIG